MAATIQLVKVKPFALANDYSAAYRATRGVECHASDLMRVRDGVIDGCPDGTAHLVEAHGRRFLRNPVTGWMHNEPAPGTFRVIKSI